MRCPRCGGECERDTVDVGVGEVAASPWGCPDCHWVEGGALTEEERLRVPRGEERARPVTVVGVCLDESGSMGQRDREGADKREAAVRAYNEFLREQQAVTADDCRWVLVKFASRARVVGPALPVAAVPPLTAQTYFPAGGTALFDAVAFCAAEMEKVPADRYVMVVLTDGEENESRETSLAQVRELIASREALGTWTFTYLSADPAAFRTAQSMGYAAGNVAAYAMSASGTAMAGQRMARSLSNFRGGLSSSTMSFYSDDDASAAPRAVTVTQPTVTVTTPPRAEEDDES